MAAVGGTITRHLVIEMTMREVFVNNRWLSYEVASRDIRWNVLQGLLGFDIDRTIYAFA